MGTVEAEMTKVFTTEKKALESLFFPKISPIPLVAGTQNALSCNIVDFNNNIHPLWFTAQFLQHITMLTALCLQDS